MIQNIVQIFMQWDGIKSIKKSYWLASRNDDTSVSITYFGTRYMTANGQVGMNHLWTVQSTGNRISGSSNHAVRAVITLKSGNKTSSGTGSSESPYELVQ